MLERPEDGLIVEDSQFLTNDDSIVTVNRESLRKYGLTDGSAVLLDALKGKKTIAIVRSSEQCPNINKILMNRTIRKNLRVQTSEKVEIEALCVEALCDGKKVELRPMAKSKIDFFVLLISYLILPFSFIFKTSFSSFIRFILTDTTSTDNLHHLVTQYLFQRPIYLGDRLPVSRQPVTEFLVSCMDPTPYCRVTPDTIIAFGQPISKAELETESANYSRVSSLQDRSVTIATFQLRSAVSGALHHSTEQNVYDRLFKTSEFTKNVEKKDQETVEQGVNDVKEVLSRKDLDAKAKLREAVSYLNEQLGEKPYREQYKHKSG